MKKYIQIKTEEGRRNGALILKADLQNQLSDKEQQVLALINSSYPSIDILNVELLADGDYPADEFKEIPLAASIVAYGESVMPSRSKRCFAFCGHA